MAGTIAKPLTPPQDEQVTEPIEKPQMQADNTAVAIADILGIDLSGAQNADIATRVVVDGVQALVIELHDAVQALNELDAEDEEMEGEEGDEEMPEEGEEGDGEEMPEDEATEEEEIPEAEAPPVIAKKKKPPFGKGVSASNDEISVDFSIPPRMIEMGIKGRQAEIRSLVANGNILPAAARLLEARWANKKAISLSLSSDDPDTDDGFYSVIESLKLSQQVDYKEKTGSQDKFKTLRQTSLDGDNANSFNPMLEDAVARREQTAN